MAPGSFACQICSRQKALAKRLELSEKELDAWFESDLFKIHEQELDSDCLSRNQSAKAEGGRNRATAPRLTGIQKAIASGEVAGRRKYSKDRPNKADWCDTDHYARFIEKSTFENEKDNCGDLHHARTNVGCSSQLPQNSAEEGWLVVTTGTGTTGTGTTGTGTTGTGTTGTGTTGTGTTGTTGTGIIVQRRSPGFHARITRHPTPVTGHVDQSRRARKRARAAKDKEQGSEDQPSNSRTSIKPRKAFNTEPLVRDDEDVPMPTVITPHSEGSKSCTSEKPHKGFNTDPLVRDNDGDAPCQLLMHLTVKGASRKIYIYIVSDVSDKLISTKLRPRRARPTLGESSLVELSDVLDELTVVPKEKHARRVSVGSEHESPTPIKNPIQKPSRINAAFWDLALSKVRGMAQNQPVSLEPKVRKMIRNVDPNDGVKAIKKLASTLAEAELWICRVSGCTWAPYK